MKTIIKILLLGLFFALIGLGLISCGARHVQKSESKEETKAETVDNSVIEKQVDTNVKTTVETKVDDKNETVTEETTYTPEDPTKEASIIEKDGTKTVLNNTKKTFTKTTKKNNTQNSVVKHNLTTEKKTEKENKNASLINEGNKVISKKEVDKKQFNPITLCIGILFIIVIIVFVLKRLKII